MKLSKIIPFILILVLLVGCQEETPTPTTPPQPTPAPPQPTEVQPEIVEGSVLLTGGGQEVTLTKYIEIDNDVRWAVGRWDGGSNLVLYSGDGGQSWADRSPLDGSMDTSNFGKAVISIWQDGSTGWVYFNNSSLLWNTTDAGLSWGSYPLDARYDSSGMISILNENVAWVMLSSGPTARQSQSILYRTIDGGVIWEVMFTYSDISGPPHGWNKNGLSFGSTEYGWLARDQGFNDKPYLDITRDGGRTWEKVNFPPPPAFPTLFDDCEGNVYDPEVFMPGLGSFQLSCNCYGDTEYPYTKFEYSTVDEGGSWTITALPD